MSRTSGPAEGDEGSDESATSLALGDLTNVRTAGNGPCDEGAVDAARNLPHEDIARMSDDDDEGQGDGLAVDQDGHRRACMTSAGRARRRGASASAHTRSRTSWRATAHGDPPLSSTLSRRATCGHRWSACTRRSMSSRTEGHANIAYAYAMGHDRLDRLEEDIGPPVDDDVSEQPDTPPYVARPLLSQWAVTEHIHTRCGRRLEGDGHVLPDQVHGQERLTSLWAPR